MNPTDAEWREAHLMNLWYEVVRAMRLREQVEWIDRQLRRWPWLYRTLSD